MTGLVARETSVIAIVAQYAPIVSAAQVQVANIVCRQLKNCRKSVAVTKKKTNEVVFCWCGQQDLNLHLLNENKNLNLARLPIPPCPHYVAILDYTSIYVNSMCPKSNIILRDTKIDLHKRLILAKILI